MDYQILRTFDELQPLREEWNALLSESARDVPFLRFEYQQAWWSTRGGGEWPETAELWVVLARQEGRLVGIAPLFLAPGQDGQPTFHLVGSIEISDYLDVIARPDDLAGFVRGLLETLAGDSLPAWQTLQWDNLLEDSPTLPALEAAARACGWSYSVERLHPSPSIKLPRDWETYLAGIDKKQRHEIRRKMRRAESGEQPVRWYTVTDGDTLEAEGAALMDLMAQDPEKAAFLTPAMREQMQHTLRLAFDGGYLQLAFLEIGGEKAAVYFNFDYQNIVWVYNSGLDGRFREYSPGWVLLGYLLQWANEQKREVFDFLRGNEDYKYRFGAVDRFVVRATVKR